MKKNQVKEIYKKKVNLLKKYDEAYFNQDNPIVSDKNYDFLKIEILKLEKKIFFLKRFKFTKQKKLVTRLLENLKKLIIKFPCFRWQMPFLWRAF